MSKEEMLEYIKEALESAEEETIAFIYWELVENA